MRASHFILEKAPEQKQTTGSLKDKVISQVKRTNDESLLDRIYTVLNQTNLSGKIGGVLDKETDTKGYVEAITKIIIDTPGTYEEKDAFITGFPTGYVDVKKMIGGDRVKFEDLLTGGQGAPMRFIGAVFEALKQVTFGTAKGPGEFALAVLSPHIRITGKGDLNIGDSIIEVKASAGKEVSSGGGRLGTPGLLDHRGVDVIIDKAVGGQLKKIAPKGLTLNGFVQLLGTLDPSKRKPLATKVFNSIFSGKADTSALATAAASGGDAAGEYVKANYQAYKEQSGFKGLMIMNFALGELKYFTDPATMASEIYSPNVYIVSGKESDAARQILSQVTLAPFKEPPLVLPTVTPTKKGTINATAQASVRQFAQELARRNGITDAPTIEEMSTFIIQELSRGANGKTLDRKLKSRYPQLVKKKATAEPTTTANTAAAPVATAPVKKAPVAARPTATPAPGAAPTKPVPGKTIKPSVAPAKFR